MKRRLAVVVLAVFATSCGGSKVAISDDAGAQLQPRVAEIRELATQRQADQVAAKLAELRSLVSDLVRDGELSEEAAGDVLAAAGGVEGQLALITTTTTTTTAPPPPRPRPLEPTKQDEDDGKAEDEKERKDDKQDEERQGDEGEGD